MKSILLKAVGLAIGQPVIFTGKTLKGGGKIMIKAGEKTIVAGAVTEAKGEQIKKGYGERAEAAAKNESLSKQEAEQARHENTIKNLKQQIADEEARHKEAIAPPHTVQKDGTVDVAATVAPVPGDDEHPGMVPGAAPA